MNQWKKWNKEEEIELVKEFKEGKRYKELSEIFERSERSIREKLRKLGYTYLKDNIHKKINWEIVTCKNCEKEFEGLKKEKRKFCSHSCNASYYNKFKIKKTGNCVNCGKILNKHYKKYCDNKCQGEHKTKQIFEKIENGDTSLYEGAYRRYLIHKHGAECMKCEWNEVNEITGKVPIQMNHIDGDSKNNDLSNLELLCPNCHSLTPNYGALNNGNDRSERQKYRKQLKDKTIEELLELKNN